MSDDDGVESEVVALIHLEGLQDAFAELAEAGMDQLISDGFLRDVPVLAASLVHCAPREAFAICCWQKAGSIFSWNSRDVLDRAEGLR